ncbi:MarR family winged helix-turn-helix transcriptional regulator [Amycolatopsis mediterranei]|uniref:MarR family winged helix-turn-helix transcriptional regulator n=1 Tax=Amycolatopsis mediterranei TaxID=33910 RepID=UPI00341EF4F6
MTRDFAPGSPFALLSDTETAAWYAYMKVYLRLEYELNRQLRADSGISLADYHVLVALTSASGGRMRVTDLAIRIGWERSRLSHHLKRMRDRGLVGTGTAAEDRRGTEVVLSAGPVLVNHDLGHLAWELGPEGAPPVVRGIDVALVEDGVIKKLYTMLLPA